MNATNRGANRLVLVIFAVIAAGLALLVIWVPTEIPDLLGALTSEWMIVAAAGALLVAGLMVAFLATRGGGRTETVLRVVAANGKTRVDQSVADEILTDGAAGHYGVTSARSKAFSVRRTPTIYIGLSVKPDAQLAEILASAERRVSEWDALATEEVPVLIHLTRRGPL